MDETTPNERLGFIGMGAMGANMARCLLRSGHQLTVWNRTPDKARAVEGATVADSPAALAAQSDLVMICVSDTGDVEQVILGEAGVLAGLAPGTLIVDHSTISPAATRRLAELVAAKGGFWLDAPVSGGTEGARNGTLSTMVGGDPAQLERARPYLQAYSTTITHVGPVGSGQMVKLSTRSWW